MVETLDYIREEFDVAVAFRVRRRVWRCDLLFVHCPKLPGAEAFC